jgi:hypothetical protein
MVESRPERVARTRARMDKIIRSERIRRLRFVHGRSMTEHHYPDTPDEIISDRITFRIPTEIAIRLSRRSTRNRYHVCRSSLSTIGPRTAEGRQHLDAVCTCLVQQHPS